jgi:HD-like signal output (HDOD) protein
VGGRVLSQWNFPEEIARGVAFHHFCEDENNHGDFAALVCLANHLARGLDKEPEKAEIAFPPLALEALQLREENILQYVDEIHSRVAREKELITI